MNDYLFDISDTDGYLNWLVSERDVLLICRERKRGGLFGRQRERANPQATTPPLIYYRRNIVFQDLAALDTSSIILDIYLEIDPLCCMGPYIQCFHSHIRRIILSSPLVGLKIWSPNLYYITCKL
jgi:hypothetical protein